MPIGYWYTWKLDVSTKVMAGEIQSLLSLGEFLEFSHIPSYTQPKPQKPHRNLVYIQETLWIVTIQKIYPSGKSTVKLQIVQPWRYSMKGLDNIESYKDTSEYNREKKNP